MQRLPSFLIPAGAYSMSRSFFFVELCCLLYAAAGDIFLPIDTVGEV